MAELLAQGADISLTDRQGNNSLHYASTNDQKAAIEILLRSGADPTVPNESGCLPGELSESPMVKDLFERDPTNIFSPMVQARALFQDYVATYHDINSSAAAAAAASASASAPSAAFGGTSGTVIAPAVAAAADAAAPVTPRPPEHIRRPSAQHPISPMLPALLADDLQSMVLSAATATAALAKLTSEERQIRFDLAKICQKLHSQQELQRIMRFDPCCPMYRLSDLGALAVDGQTPLHLAARFGNLEVLKIFLQEPEQQEQGGRDEDRDGRNVSLWVRDLQGRTPLHVAVAAAAVASRGHGQEDTLSKLTETIAFLREHMTAERSDPIGPSAPMDLAGITPLGMGKIASKGTRLPCAIEGALFSPGDASILPFSPLAARSGKSPWKAPLSLYTTRPDNLLYGLAEAAGWTGNMEDRHVVSLPLPGRPSWGLFAVFDGHGGTTAAQFLQTRFPAILVDLAGQLEEEMGSAHLPGGMANDSDTNPELLTDLLVRACLAADCALAQLPRMKVESKQAGKKLVCMDKSGSTAIIVLLTSTYIATANVGDSRAVMALRSMEIMEMSNPFGSTDEEADAVPKEISTPRRRPSRRRSSTIPLNAIELSRDHKASIPEERMRIEKAGAEVQLVASAVSAPASSPSTTTSTGTAQEVWEVSTTKFDAKLRMTRAFGDFYLKQNTSLSASEQAIIALPEVRVITRNAA